MSCTEYSVFLCYVLVSWVSESSSVVSNSLRPHGLYSPWNSLYSPWNSPGQNAGLGSCSLLQGIFPNQGSNLGLPHCRWILYQLSHQGSPSLKVFISHIVWNFIKDKFIQNYFPLCLEVSLPPGILHFYMVGLVIQSWVRTQSQNIVTVPSQII